MLLYISPSSDPAFNLAAEEYFLSSAAGDLLFLWVSEPSVIVGKFQNPYEEVSLAACEERGVPVVRRNSGGGTVYHDPGNLNYTVLTDRGTDFPDFGRFLAPVVAMLAECGVKAQIRDTSALFADGKKISGNAQSCVRVNPGSGGPGKERQMHHGTLLFDSDLAALTALTGRPRGRFSSRAVKSNPSPVANLGPLLAAAGHPMTFAGFRAAFAEEYPRRFRPGEPVGPLILTEEETEKIEALRRGKYASWDWNFGRSPAFSFDSPELKFTAKNGVILHAETNLCPPETLIGIKLIPEVIRAVSEKAEKLIF